MIRLSFRSPSGEAPTRLAAAYFRICANGIVRGPENYPVALFNGGWWMVSGKRHREFDCEGPVNLRLSSDEFVAAVTLGPFAQVRTAAGIFFGDNVSLDVAIPGFVGSAGSREVTLLSAAAPAPFSHFGDSRGKA